MKQTLMPHLWFDKEAVEASQFYTSIFPDSQVTHTSIIKDTPSGDCDIVHFTIMGYQFQAISAGPYFKLNPSISFMVHLRSKEQIDQIWKKLIDGGEALMPLDTYDFNEHYGWVKDKFGVTWQLMFTDQKTQVVPALMFVQDNTGKAEEATDYYIDIFKNSPLQKANETKRGIIARYPAGVPSDLEGTVMYTDFQLAGQLFAAMDSGQDHKFNFNEGVSIIVSCESQEEIDYLWKKLSAVPESEQCGWLKDKYGVSWQIVPSEMDAMMEEGTEKQKQAVTKSFLKMKKFNIEELRRAYISA